MPACGTELRELEECLRGLLAVLPQDPARAREAMRELLARDKESFLAVALPLLKQADDSQGLQYLFVLLLANGLLPPCDPRLLSLEEEIRIARRVKETDPFLDLKLARRFSAAAREPHATEADTSGRILEVLAAIADHSRILPMLVQLMRHPNARLRSKVALLVARSNRSAQWVGQMLSEPDARVRANAVEALWGVETETARGVLWLASRDTNNRVAGNALLGLHRLGETGAVGPLLELSAHERPVFRSTAAWAMGETEDPRFLPRLAQMVRESDSNARHNVFRAIGRINRAVAAVRQQPPLHLHAIELLAQPDGSRLLRVAITAGEGGEISGLRPTAFVLYENGRLVLDYAVQKQRPPESVALGLALPAAREPQHECDVHISAALESCLRVKRNADRWAILRFATKPRPADASAPAAENAPAEHDTGIATSELLRTTRCLLTSDPNALRKNAESGSAIRPGSLDAAQLLLSTLACSTGTRQLLLVQDWVSEPAWADTDGQEWEAVGKLAQGASVTLHAIALRAAPPAALEALSGVCQVTGGRLLVADHPDQFPVLGEKLCSGLLHSYEITYRSEAQTLPGEVRLQLCSPQGFGEDTLRM